MNIEITDLDNILNYLETTSLEPHDDYSSEFTYKEQKILYKYIKQLQQENKQLKERMLWAKNDLEKTMSIISSRPIRIDELFQRLEYTDNILKGDDK